MNRINPKLTDYLFACLDGVDLSLQSEAVKTRALEIIRVGFTSGVSEAEINAWLRYWITSEWVEGNPEQIDGRLNRK